MSLEDRLTEADIVAEQNPNWKPVFFWTGTIVKQSKFSRMILKILFWLDRKLG